MRTTLLLILTTILLASPLHAQTEIEGELSGVLGEDDDSYILVDDCTISADDTLTILPGVSILFENGFSLTVEGLLTAYGSRRDTIRFIGDENNLTGEIVLATDEDIPTYFTYCHFSYMEDALTSQSGGYLSVANSYFLENDHAIFVALDSCSVFNCTFLAEDRTSYLRLGYNQNNPVLKANFGYNTLLGSMSPRFTCDTVLTYNNYTELIVILHTL